MSAGSLMSSRSGPRRRRPRRTYRRTQVPTEITEKLGELSAEEFQQLLDGWIAGHAGELREYEPDESLSVEQVTAFPRRFQNLLYDAGWLRAGWPAELGGPGGSGGGRRAGGE